MTQRIRRRTFLSSTIASGAALGGLAGLQPVYAQPAPTEEKPRHKVERIGIGAIGLRYQGTVIADKARLYGDIVALADVDRNVREQARAGFGSTPAIYEDYRELLARKDIDVITIGTPDHWHVKMAIDACRAGKDVYVEKPLSLTIAEGKLLLGDWQSVFFIELDGPRAERQAIVNIVGE